MTDKQERVPAAVNARFVEAAVERGEAEIHPETGRVQYTVEPEGNRAVPTELFAHGLGAQTALTSMGVENPQYLNY